MKTYIIVTSYDTDDLEYQVRAKIGEGYAPFGNMVVYTHAGTTKFSQPMMPR